jgi:hypothetical protein
MVNTFIVTDDSDVDYSKSASYLDFRRLNKQIVEAVQILRTLKDHHKVASFYNMEPLPPITQDVATSFLQRCEWVKMVQRQYVKKNTCLVYVFRKDKLVVQEWSKEVAESFRVKDLSPSSKIEYEDGNILFKGNTYPRDKIFVPHLGERMITLKQYATHPMTRMWIGHEDSLRVYINSHIREWLSRKRKNGQPTKCSTNIFHVPPLDEIEHPWWRGYEGVYLSHRASLLRKEKTRNEDPHYWHIDLLLKVVNTEWYDNGYVWACNLSVETIRKILRGEIDVLPHEVCAPISADVKPSGKPTYAKVRFIYYIDGKEVVRDTC